MDDRAELIRQIKKIDIATGGTCRGLHTGFHHSVFKGQGIEFTEIREDTPGDDIRAIDWKVTARYNRPFVKEFTEERDQTFYFVADISARPGLACIQRKKERSSKSLQALPLLRSGTTTVSALCSSRTGWQNLFPQNGAGNTLQNSSTS